VIYAIPPASAGTSPYAVPTDNWMVREGPAWPPRTMDAGSQFTFNLHSTGTYGLDTATPDANEADVSITNPLMQETYATLCPPATKYSPGDAATYTSPVLSTTLPSKLVNFKANLWMKTGAPRLQVFVDLFEVKMCGSTEIAEVPIWANYAVKIPTARNIAPGVLQNFVFRPGDAGVTIPAGNKLRIKVASNLRSYFAQEPYPSWDTASYTKVVSNATNTSKFSFDIAA
jgi:predicted acyl esterase